MGTARMEQLDSALFQGEMFNPPGTHLKRCPRRALTVWRIETAVSCAWATVIMMVPVWLIALLWQKQPLWWLAAPLALTVPWFVWKFFRLRVMWVMRAHWLGPQELWVRGGLRYRYLSSAPYGRVQECTISSTFWARQFKLASVDISIGARSELSIADIDPADAEEIVTTLRRLALDRGVQL